MELKPGDRVRLNAAVRLFADREAVVDEVKHWGVVCYVRHDDGGKFWLRASWDQIEHKL